MSAHSTWLHSIFHSLLHTAQKIAEKSHLHHLRFQTKEKIPLLLTATILVAQVRKAPHVGQIHGKPDDREQEVHLAGPCFPLVGLGQVQTVARFPRGGLDLSEGGHRQGDFLPGATHATVDAVFAVAVHQRILG